MATATGKTKHKCPPISGEFSLKMSGPAYIDGTSATTARSQWLKWKRSLEASAKKMPRKLS